MEVGKARANLPQTCWLRSKWGTSASARRRRANGFFWIAARIIAAVLIAAPMGFNLQYFEERFGFPPVLQPGGLLEAKGPTGFHS